MKNFQWLKFFLNVSSFHDLYVLKRRKHQYQGFTLIELLVVIMIMTILSGIAIPTYLSLVRIQQVQVVAYEIQEYIKEAHRDSLGGGQRSLEFLPTAQAGNAPWVIFKADGKETKRIQIGKGVGISPRLLDVYTNFLWHNTIIFEEGKAILPYQQPFIPFTIKVDIPERTASTVWSSCMVIWDDEVREVRRGKALTPTECPDLESPTQKQNRIY